MSTITRDIIGTSEMAGVQFDNLKVLVLVILLYTLIGYQQPLLSILGGNTCPIPFPRHGRKGFRGLFFRDTVFYY